MNASAPVFAAVAPQAAAPTAKSDKLVIQGSAAPVPGAWTRSQSSSTMRVAQFALPPAPGADAGELVGFFFLKCQIGSQQAHIERWVSQFSNADGKPDQTLMTALVETSIGRITLPMCGPNKTVAVQRDNFLKLAKGFQPA